MATIAKVKGIEKLSVSDLKALVSAANWIGIQPDWLASVISFESGFNPSIKNGAGSGATGLIQFMPDTAKRIGTTTDALAKMSFQQQLVWVKKYFEPVRGKLKSLEDTYLVVFYPSAVGKPLDYVIGSSPSKTYLQNKGFDSSGKGYITKADVTGTIRKVLAAAGNQRISVPILGLGTFLVFAATAYYLYKKA